MGVEGKKKTTMSGKKKKKQKKKINKTHPKKKKKKNTQQQKDPNTRKKTHKKKKKQKPQNGGPTDKHSEIPTGGGDVQGRAIRAGGYVNPMPAQPWGGVALYCHASVSRAFLVFRPRASRVRSLLMRSLAKASVPGVDPQTRIGFPRTVCTSLFVRPVRSRIRCYERYLWD